MLSRDEYLALQQNNTWLYQNQEYSLIRHIKVISFYQQHKVPNFVFETWRKFKIYWPNELIWLLQTTQEMRQRKYMQGILLVASMHGYSLGKKYAIPNILSPLLSKRAFSLVRYPCGFNLYTLQSMSKDQFHSSNSSHLLFSCLNSLICLISPHQ